MKSRRTIDEIASNHYEQLETIGNAAGLMVTAAQQLRDIDVLLAEVLRLQEEVRRLTPSDSDSATGEVTGDSERAENVPGT